MSAEAMAIALHHSRASTAIGRMVLLGIANHDGDGGAWPAVATLARYAATTPRSVQRAVDELERLGEVRRIVQEGGQRHTADHLRPNLYQFLLVCPPDCDRSKHHRTRRHDAVRVELAGLDEGYPQPGDMVSPGDVVSGDPVTPRHPKQNLRRDGARTTDQEQTARARVQRFGWDHACIDGLNDTHQVSSKTQACAYCGARRTSWTEEA